MDLSVIIVNYNTYELTRNAVESVLQAQTQLGDRHLDYEVILVDNASSDGSIEKLKQDYADEDRVKIIVNDENLGFSKANNIGMKASTGDHILLMNSDTVIEPDALVKTVGFLEDHPEVGGLGAKVVLGDGVTMDHAAYRGFPTPIASMAYILKLDKLFPGNKTFGSFELGYLDPDETHEIDTTTCAYMCVPREVYEKIGGLDEDYFMYGEDLDWCYRIRQAGYKIIYNPKIHVTHFKKSSWNGKKNPKVLDSFYDSMAIFYNKHYKDQYSKLTGLLVNTAVQSLKGIARLKNQLKK